MAPASWAGGQGGRGGRERPRGRDLHEAAEGGGPDDRLDGRRRRGHPLGAGRTAGAGGARGGLRGPAGLRRRGGPRLRPPPPSPPLPCYPLRTLARPGTEEAASRESCFSRPTCGGGARGGAEGAEGLRGAGGAGAVRPCNNGFAYARPPAAAPRCERVGTCETRSPGLVASRPLNHAVNSWMSMSPPPSVSISAITAATCRARGRGGDAEGGGAVPIMP